ncbi:hypothetical protein [Vulcanisaeta souniana]|uniref:Uncharacterized protein n=1 Tax=Vulcanisaeta souniana JCM 11219 TaxID=1293586 RepID=A0A830E5X3_9CREN|nr:hypothetical protein [Vulcanisaeta souniana]BDR92900.1 hypothetical protein Vsou_19930 [Vulcanisaeta souniana JCM 11219]GGI85478.1 hypothetical protein GCM10007112_23160 [Vulcanisaeta souniana JCM 11219]
MISYRKLSLMRVKGLTLVITAINNEKHLLMNREALKISREVNRLLGLRRCSSCGRWIKPEDIGYVEINGNRVTRTLCQECLNTAYSGIAEAMIQCLG